MEQADLGQYGGDARPAEEAAAVADDDGGATVVDTDSVRFPDPQGTVRLSVTQVDYTVEGRGDEEFPVVHVFGRAPADDGHPDLEHVEVYDFEPYFYAPADGVDAERIAEYDGLVDYRETDEDGEPFESIRGERLVKIIGRTPRDVGQVRDEFDHYEADILFPNRFLIDKDIKSGVRVPERRTTDGTIRVPHEEVDPVEESVTARVNTFDIEVDDRRGFPEDGEEPIVCLTSHDSYEDQYINWLYQSPAGVDGPRALEAYDPIEDDFEADVRVFEAEEAMLEAFVDYVEEETDPDYFTGWNCLPADSKIQMADGIDSAIEDVETGDEVLGVDGQEPTTATVTNKWKSEKAVLEFELADGTTLRTSGDHRIMVGDDDAVDWTRGRHVEPGDFVVKPRRTPVYSPTVPTLADLVPRDRQRYDQETVESFRENHPYGAVTELADEFDATRSYLWKNDPTVWNVDRCQTAAERFDVPLPDGGYVHKRTEKPLDRELSEREVYLAGLVLTDGSMSRTDGIRFYNTCKQLHEKFADEPHLQPDGKGCYKQNVLDFATMYAFHGLGIPYGNKNEGDVDLSTVYGMPEEYIARFIAGVIDGDGHVSTDISVAAENRSIGRWYVKLFRRLGIYAEQRDNVVRIPRASREVNRLKDTVLPHMSHPDKTTALEGLSGGKSARTESIPHALFEADEGTDERRIGRDKYRRGINLKRHETNRDEWEDYVFVEIEDVAAIGTETTYDIETTTHNFVAEDCLVHNCDDFDAPYLLDRMEALQSPNHEYDLGIDRLSRIDEVWRSDWNGPDIKGRVVFDLLRAYRATQFTELESYRLDAVGEQELGAGKERYPGDIGDLWEDDPERLLEYNLRDVELCVELDRKQDIIAFFEEVASFVGCKLEDAPTAGDAVDMYVLHKAHGEFALPSKGTVESGEEFEGGAVFDPITGVRENVSVLDLKCFSGDTEVLTPAGGKNIRDVQVGDPVYTLDPETFECEVKPVEETHEYENRFGELHHVSGNTHDFKVTENHRFLVSTERGWDEQTPADFEFTEYRDLTDTRRYAFPQHEPMGGRTPDQFDLVDEVDGGYVVVYSEEDLRRFRNRMPESVTESLDLVHGSSGAVGLQRKAGKYLIPIDVYREHRELVQQHADHVFLKYGPQHRETPLSFEMTDWLAFLGWFVTEGSVDHGSNRVTIHQQDERNRETICSLLDEMEVNYSTDARGVNISNRYLREWLETNCGRGFSEKRLPDWVFDLHSDLLQRLLETMIRGQLPTPKGVGLSVDSRTSRSHTKAPRPLRSKSGLSQAAFSTGVGAVRSTSPTSGLADGQPVHPRTSAPDGRVSQFVPKSNQAYALPPTAKAGGLPRCYRCDGSRTTSGLGKFWTKSDDLKDAVVDIAVRCGEKPTVSQEQDGTWYVSVGKRGSFKKESNATVEDHDGTVYCLTAEDNHVVLAGRNGHYQWVGQSLYPMCMWTTNASPETKVDPEEYAGETYRTPTGQHFRAEPPGMMREMIDELLTEREEKKELRDSHDPETEAYDVYDRQQASVKVIMNCFTPDTEVLTPEGVRGIRSLDVGDEVYSLDPETMEMEVKSVLDTHAYPNYDGELVDIETDKIDFSVTPNHRMLVRKDERNGISWNEDDYRFVEAGDLDRATNYELPHDWDGPDGERIDEVDLTELLDDYELWVRPDVHGHTFAAEIGYYPNKVKKNDIGKEGYVFDADEFEKHREYIDEVAEQCFVHSESNRKWIPRFYDGDDFLELLAWYITEGNVYTSEEKKFGDKLRGSATTIKLAQDAPAVADGGDREERTESDHAAIGALLDRMGFDYYVDDRSYQFTSRLLGRFLERECGENSFEKRVPDFVFDATTEQKRQFLEVLIDGDGDRQQNAWRYSTASDRLRDDVLRLCAHLGLTANYREESDTWRIYVTEDSKNTLRMHRSGERGTAEEGVYCVTVADNHTLLAGRNGKFQFVGNSLYGVSGWDRFRLYDKDSAAAVTATGREAINYTEETVNEFGYEVIYGDTDSVMISLREDMSTDEVIERSFELEKRINDSYDGFAREELDAEEHRFEIEFEKLYRRFFQAGKKKRYAGHIVWKEGKEVDDIDITGFEYQRSDIAPITKEVQHEVIEMIVHGEDVEDVKDYVHDVIEDYQAGNVSFDDVGIPGGIGKKLDNYDTDTAQVRGAKYANLLLGTNFGNGSKPKRLYLEKVHPEFFRRVEDEQGLDPAENPLYGEFKRDPDVICFEYADQIPEEFEVDWDKMLDKTLKGPIARILEALDVSWEEVKSGQEQTGLGQYM